MRTPTASELLAVWELGRHQPPVQRGLLLLEAAEPYTPRDALARLSIGERDHRLLRLRQWSFGPTLVCAATCPECEEPLEMRFDVSDILFDTPEGSGEAIRLTEGGYELELRLPNSLDLAAMSDQADARDPHAQEAGRRLLLERCVLEVKHNGSQAALEDLPTNVVEAIAHRLAEADPQADVQLALSCPACGHQWRATFDILSFLWREIETWAHRLLHQVHTLALAYGWREADILAMSPARRQAYLDLVTR